MLLSRFARLQQRTLAPVRLAATLRCGAPFSTATEKRGDVNAAEEEYRLRRQEYKRACSARRREFLAEHKQTIAVDAVRNAAEREARDVVRAEKRSRKQPPPSTPRQPRVYSDAAASFVKERSDREAMLGEEREAKLVDESEHWLTAVDLPELKARVDAMLETEQPYHEPYRSVLPKRAGRRAGPL